MIGLAAGARIWLAAGATDMRRGMDGLAALVQEALTEKPFSGHVFVFRGRHGDLIKLLCGFVWLAARKVPQDAVARFDLALNTLDDASPGNQSAAIALGTYGKGFAPFRDEDANRVRRIVFFRRRAVSGSTLGLTFNKKAGLPRGAA